MPPTKAELEAHRHRYNTLISQARSALNDGLYSKAVDLAWASWQFVDGMMQYERRYEDREFENIEAIDIVLQYAPILFEFQKLDELEALLKNQRRIDKNASDDLAAKLADARTRMWDAHRLWNYLESQSDVRQDKLRQSFGGVQDQWRQLTEAWEKMGVIRRTTEGGSYRLSLVTRLDEPVDAKCFSCGSLSHGPKRDFLNECSCPHCQQKTLLVILVAATNAVTKE